MKTNESDITRRRLIQMTGGVSIAALAGCSANGGTKAKTPRPDPISLGDGKQCDACGMVIEGHSGPNAMAFYRDNEPEGHGNPAWFDSVFEMVIYDAEHRRTGWERVVAYVTDYSNVQYAITTEQGTERISSHVERESFVEATEANYLIGSDVEGAMGADFLPFTDIDEAKSFSEENGGEVVAFGDLPTTA